MYLYFIFRLLFYCRIVNQMYDISNPNTQRLESCTQIGSQALRYQHISRLFSLHFFDFSAGLEVIKLNSLKLFPQRIWECLPTNFLIPYETFYSNSATYRNHASGSYLAERGHQTSTGPTQKCSNTKKLNMYFLWEKQRIK